MGGSSVCWFFFFFFFLCIDAKYRGSALPLQDVREPFAVLKVREKQPGIRQGWFQRTARRGRGPGDPRGAGAAGSARGASRRRRARRGCAEVARGCGGRREKLRNSHRSKQHRPVLLPPLSPLVGFFSSRHSFPFLAAAGKWHRLNGVYPQNRVRKTGPLRAWSTLLGPKHIHNSA